MSTASISQNSPVQQLQPFFHHRTADLLQLRQAIESGNLQDAQTAFQNLIQLGQKGPTHGPAPFFNSTRAQDFEAIGKALQAGDLQGAQQALHALVQTFQPGGHEPLPAVQPSGAPATSAGGGGVNVNVVA